MVEAHEQQDLLMKLALEKIVALEGGNFSGRSDLLRRVTGMADSGTTELRPTFGEERPAAYIGPEVYNAISGLALTVREELRLHVGGEPEHASIAGLVEDTGLTLLYDQNPFTLSGGEQSCLALASALALKPSAVAVDCALEQVDASLKPRLLWWLEEGLRAGTSTLLADNCLSELDSAASMVKQPISGAVGGPDRRLRFDPLDADVSLPPARQKPCSLTLDALSFSYARGRRILRDVSVRLEPGALYFLEGRNGSGKSTLAKLLCGVLRQDSGRIYVEDAEHRPWRRPGGVVAYHFQNPDVQLFATSVEEEIQSGPRAFGYGPAKCAERADRIMAAFGLTHVRREHPLDLPFVIRKRVALAATLAMGCPWAILDEPTLGQDGAAREVIAQIIRGLLDAGVGIIVISHSRQFRELLSAKSLRLEGGALEH